MSSSLPLSVTSLVHTLALSVGRDSPNLGTLSGRALVEQWVGANAPDVRDLTGRAERDDAESSAAGRQMKIFNRDQN
jgi:hypothetical protein